MKYEAVIGLEVHLQTNTKSKMFCGCSADYFGAEPNTHTCPVCLGLPGALPFPNKAAIEKAIKIALALNCKIHNETKFDRKNYFYPDLPKAYQISQYDKPIGFEGFLEIDSEIKNESKKIRITRVHQEEDTGKSTHNGEFTYLDFNKSGCPLVEIVSEPDMSSTQEVMKYAKRLRQIVRYLGVSNADMEKGEMRFEINMSLRKVGEKALPNYKVEVKNIGSISVLEKVIEYEFKRQERILEEGKTPDQETRGLKNMSGETFSQRKKEGEADYRYFPEPDIPPIIIDGEQIAKVKSEIPELPQEKKKRYINDFQLDSDIAETIVVSKQKSQFFESIIQDVSDKEIINTSAKWFIGDFTSIKKTGEYDEKNVSPKSLLELVKMVLESKVTGKAAKDVLIEMFKTGESPSQLVSKMGLETISDQGFIEDAVKKVIENNAKVVADLSKNPNAIGFLVGQVMRETKGKANPSQVSDAIKKNLGL